MTRDHHEGYGIPSNARYRQHAYPMREPNADPGYDRAAQRVLPRIVRRLLGLVR